jgi:hypothetical protein
VEIGDRWQLEWPLLATVVLTAAAGTKNLPHYPPSACVDLQKMQWPRNWGLRGHCKVGTITCTSLLGERLVQWC